MEYIIIGIIVATIVFMLSGIRVVNQYQRGANLSDDYDGRCPLDADRCAKARGHYER